MNQQVIKEKDRYIEEIQSKAGDKYNCAGLYTISVNDTLLYIGKSENIIERIASHMYHMNFNTTDSKSNKYKILKDLKWLGYPICFDKLYQTDEIDTDNIKEDIGYQEAKYINRFKPVLNYQVPRLDDWHRFSVNPIAKNIKIEEVVRMIEAGGFGVNEATEQARPQDFKDDTITEEEWHRLRS